MATILAPQFGREVLRCNHCDLVQFPSSNELCRRCRQPYDRECSLQANPTEPCPIPNSYPRADSIRDRIACNVLSLRQLRGLTQTEVGLRMGVPRTYLSKIEGRKVTPNLSTLARLATVLGTSTAALLVTPNGAGDEFSSAPHRDPFLRQMSRFASRLTVAQITQVLDCARRLIERQQQKHRFRSIPSCEEKQCFAIHCCSTSSPDAASKTSTHF